MAHAKILRFEAEKDLLDRLRVRTSMDSGAFNATQTEFEILGFQGCLAFYSRGVDPTTTLPEPLRRTLPADLVRTEHSTRVAPGAERVIEFTAGITRQALDRLDAWRAGGSLFMRVEGKLIALSRSTHVDRQDDNWVLSIQARLLEGKGPLLLDLRTESTELHPQRWSSEVLSKLRPPGHFFFEVATPVPDPEQSIPRAVADFEKAQKAFDDGRYDDVARLAYRVLDEVKKHGDVVERRYGALGKRLLMTRINDLRSVCNPDRHAEAPEHDGLSFDRTLAQHTLADTASAMGLVFRRASGDE